MRVKSPARLVLGCLTYILPILLWIGSMIGVFVTDAFVRSSVIGWVSIATLLGTSFYMLRLVTLCERYLGMSDG